MRHPDVRHPPEAWLDGASTTVHALVRAALASPDALMDFPAGLPSVPLSAAAPDGPPAKLWLESLSVEGFRGAGPRVRLSLPPGPGLTVLAGRNGTGKSTLAEGLETLLCGQSARWQGKDRASTSGWANLHGDAAVLRARLRRDGTPVELLRTWDGPRVAQSTLSGDEGLPSPEVARAWRPVLSCGDLLDRIRGNPSAVYDAVASGLGLDRYTEAIQALSERRRQLEQQVAEAAAERERLMDALATLPGEEASQARTLLEGHALAELLAALDTTPLDDEIVRWMGAPELSAEPPEVGAVREALDAHRQAVAAADAGAEAQRALLRAAVALEPTGDCPLCGTEDALSPDWYAAARQTLASSTTSADRREALAAQLQEASLALQRLATSLTPWLEDSGLPWLPLPERPAALAHHVGTWWPAVCTHMAERRRRARVDWARLGASWHPMVASLRAWVEQHRAALALAGPVDALREAEALLGKRAEVLRASRFAPIQEGALAMWSSLRRGSSVSLTSVALAGRRTRRNLDLEVAIDGVEGKAQGVMSQGELNALALALFLPRAMLADNPYGFVVIDDPVQAMDPGKVAGLAQVLADVATACQTVVLTHDERLLDALRWLAVPHRVLRVARGARSQVSVAEVEAPMEQLLHDAERVLSSARLPVAVRDRSVPGLCRLALEMGLRDLLAMRWLRQGVTPGEVAARLSDGASLRQLLGLWCSDSACRVSDETLREALTACWAPSVSLVEALQAGAHGEAVARVGKLPGRTKQLVRALRQSERSA